MSDINVNPTGVFANYAFSSDGSFSASSEGIFIPLADIPQLTTNEANEAHSSADYRKLMLGMLSAVESHYSELDSEDKPSNMTISKSSLNFLDEDTAQRSFSLTFKFEVPELDVEDEAS